MTKVFVDKLPEIAEDCPFSIMPSDPNYPANCKCMMNKESDWTNMTFSNDSGHYRCVLDRMPIVPCPFLRKLKFY